MNIGSFRLGMRTIKTALAVMICIFIFHFTNRGTPMIAALSAVFAMRQDLTSTYTFGKSRVIGNALGGIIALLYYVVQDYFNYLFLVQLFLVPFLVIVVIVLSDAMDNNTGIVGGVATLLLLVLNISKGESAYYILARVLDTFIGTFVAILVNALIKPPKKEKLKEVDKDLLTLGKEEEKLETLKKELKK